MFLRCRDRASASREGLHNYSFADDSPEFVAALVGVGIAAAASVLLSLLLLFYTISCYSLSLSNTCLFKSLC